MRSPVLLLLLVVVYGVMGAPNIAEEDDVLVPKEALRLILGCQADRYSGAPGGPVPVYHTDIDTETGTTSQKLTLLDTEQLRDSLRGSVHSEEVLELIISRLNAAVHSAPTAGNSNRLRYEALPRDSNSTAAEGDAGCTIHNNIDISVPAQEVDSFNDRVQMLIQQNSFLLLEQINTLFTYKLRSLREDFENMVRERTKKINRKLDAVLKALGATPPPATGGDEHSEEVESPSVSEPTTGTSAEVETTDAPGVAGEELPDEDEETTEDPPKDSSEDDEEGTRNVPARPGASRRPVASRRPARPLSRYQTQQSRYQTQQTTRTRTTPLSRTSTVRPTSDEVSEEVSEKPKSKTPIRTESDRQSQMQLRRRALMNARKEKARQRKIVVDNEEK